MFLCEFQYLYVKLGLYPCVAPGTIIFYKDLVFYEALPGERGSDPFASSSGGAKRGAGWGDQEGRAERGGVNGYT